MNGSKPTNGPNVRHRFAANMLGEVSEAGRLMAEFDDAGIFFIRNYDKAGFAKDWVEHLGISPLALAGFITEELEGHPARIELSLNDNGTCLKTDLSVAKPGRMRKPNDQLLSDSRVFNLSDGVISDGDLQKSSTSKINGKAVARRLYELGHLIGCDRLELEAGKKGIYVWANIFEIDEVLPEFQSEMKQRLDRISGQIDPILNAFLQDAIAHGDIKSIASVAHETPHSLSNADYMRLYKETRYLENPPPVTIGKYLLFDETTRGWHGHFDMTNAEHCARAHQRLSPWKLDDLREQAEGHIRSQEHASQIHANPRTLVAE
ncbi:MAG: hypothetical protein AB8B83_02745 [Bdellovibrionales bacterium]